jgi:hypothetical protein
MVIFNCRSNNETNPSFLASVMVEIGEYDKGVPVSAKIVFVRDRRTKKWLALLSIDTSLDDEQIVMAYKRRWRIEVFFKMAKPFLNLAKERPGRSYDALVAHATVVWVLPIHHVGPSQEDQQRSPNSWDSVSRLLRRNPAGDLC